MSSCLRSHDYTVPGILQARILEWVAFPFSRGSSQPRDRTQVSHIAGGFFTQLSHKGSPRILEWIAYPSPGDLPNPGIEPGSPGLQVDSLPAEPAGKWSRAWVLHTGALPALAVWSLNHRITRRVPAKRVSLYFSRLEFSSSPFKICMFFIMSFLWWYKKKK